MSSSRSLLVRDNNIDHSHHSPAHPSPNSASENAALDKRHIAIALGVGISLVALITMCLIFPIFLHRNRQNNSGNRDPEQSTSHHTIFPRRDRPKKPKKSPSQKRLRKLDAESPTCTLEEWWIRRAVESKRRGSLSSSPLPPIAEGEDGGHETEAFICAICLESVHRSHEIRDLKCLHIFHKDCLDKWYLQDQFHCPLCHRAYFQQQYPPANEFVWMV